MARFPWAFFVLAIGFAWLVTLPGVLASRGLVSLPVPNLALVALAQFGASLAAFLLVYRNEGTQGVKRLAARALDIRIAPAWLAVIVFLPLALHAAALLLHAALGGVLSSPPLLTQPLLMVPYFVFIFLLQGPIPEEFGWRGYALDRLQARWSALTASLVLGIAWGVYHLPAFYMEGIFHSSLPLWLFLVQVLALSVLFTWIYNNTGNNLFAALLFHTMVNFANVALPVIEPIAGADQRAYMLVGLLYVIAAAVVIALWGPRRLSRQHEFAPAPTVEQGHARAA